MDLIIQISSREALDAALAAGVSGVVVDLPRGADQAWWAEAAAWQAAARGRGVRFQLQWDRLIREEEFSQAQETLAQAAALQPDALILRDPGLCREARSLHPELVLHASAACGYHNSPGLRLAAGLGYRQVALSGPFNLKDLALLRRQIDLPLEVVLPQPCPGHLCLLEDYPEAARSPGCQPPQGWPAAAAGFLAVLELLPGLAQFGVAAVLLGWVFSQARTLRRVIELCQLLWEASPSERPRVLAAARDVIGAFGEEFHLEFPAREPRPPGDLPGQVAAAGGSQAAAERPRSAPDSGRVWLEARDYAEAAFLTRDWREPLILLLNRKNYAAFLGQYSRWHPRRFIWRLPPLIPESALSFFQQAILTLKQGGFGRFLAADWGAVQLVGEAGGLAYGEQSLGVRNSRALLAANDLGVSRVCLPPGRGPKDWQELVQASPRGSFWGYLYHLPPLMVCPRGEGDLSVPGGENLRWLSDGDLALLLPEAAENLGSCRPWFEQKWVAPLVVSLIHSDLPWGTVPDLARPPRPQKQGPGARRPGGERQRPGVRRPGSERQGAGTRGQGPERHRPEGPARQGQGGRGPEAEKKGPGTRSQGSGVRRPGSERQGSGKQGQGGRGPGSAKKEQSSPKPRRRRD